MSAAIAQSFFFSYSKQLLQTDYKKYIQWMSNYVTSNSNTFWSLFNTRPKHDRIPTVIQLNGMLTTEDEPRPPLFNIYFHRKFSTTTPTSLLQTKTVIS